nr:uncharacterized protein LOC128702351 [Cherax quadricarinatus]
MRGAPDRHNETSHEGAFIKFNFNNKNIKWDQVNQVLTDISWEDILSNTDPNLCLEQINSVALDVCTRLIPLRKRRSRCKIERDRRSLYRRRKRITERLKEVNISEMRRETLVREIASIELKLKESYRSQESREELKAINEIERNPKYFFSYAKSKSRTMSSIGPLLKQDGSYTDDSKEMSELLKSQYDSVFSKPLTRLRVEDQNEFFMREPQNLVNTSLSDVILTPNDFEQAINDMPMHSAPGPDSWNSVFIKNCKKPLSRAFSILWRGSMDTGVVPQLLKTTDIAPLHKGAVKQQQRTTDR